MAAMFEDQLVPEVVSSESHVGLVLPKNWESQWQCVQKYNLLATSEDRKFCAKMMQKTMQVTVKQVTKVQNLWLLEAVVYETVVLNLFLIIAVLVQLL